MKETIKKTIQNFDLKNFYESSLLFFNSLGYDSDKRSKLVTPNFDGFIDQFKIEEENVNKEKALVSDWQEIQFLFQLSDDEILRTDQTSLFQSNDVDQNYLKSYLFVSISLNGEQYTKTDLVNITRQINKQFLQPVLILFSYSDLLCLSVIDRRINKKDSDKDVLEKVTLIKDIRKKKPHRAHIEILHDMALSNLEAVNFDQLHKEFRRVLDTEELNKKFYKKLSNWYFWALTKIEFPKLDNNTQENSNSIGLIRLITRFIFIWFMKERQLIPEKFFNKNFIDSILDYIDSNDSTYYKAIMQNLFFATLNQEMDKREFRKPNQNYNITNLYRYENFFKIGTDEILKLFSQIPFLNGGLFECLDKPNPTEKVKQGGAKVIRIDGYSDRDDNPIKVQDTLFFQKQKSYPDLNDFYGTKNKRYEVIGLIELLSSYKFTIEENTPVDQEIALDPELLGRVFENLLASYNPETQTTARKQTGSFYTPREIVNYMVDESLKAYLKQKLETEAALKPEEAERKLELLIGYNETYFQNENRFDDKQTNIIIKAIDNCKILDPACGSGAFPMGILHKLVHILHKLDADNKLWKEVQRQKAIKETEEAFKIGNKEERETRLKEISDIFEYNSDDYGRKLFLIENCIYGVDIQPIATQISKLRFFISLIVDQKTDKERDNFGIRPLPNLETKFVAANTLIGIEKSVDSNKWLENIDVQELEEKLKDIRHRLFSAKTTSTKRKLREEDQRLRAEISERLERLMNMECMSAITNSKEKSELDYYKDLIKRNGEKQEYFNEIKKRESILHQIENNFKSKNHETAQQLVSWDPYNQNASSPFFDPEWMFGITDGFDVVIGNPPYVQLQKEGGKLANLFKNNNYSTYERTGDIYSLFYENGIKNLNKNGHLCFITSNKWMRAGYGKSLRRFFLNYNPVLLIDCGPGIFENATVDVNILLINNNTNKKELFAVTLDKEAKEKEISQYVKANSVLLPNLNEDSWFIGSNAEQQLKEKIEKIGKPLKEWDVNINYGIKTGLNEAFIIDTETKEKIYKEDPNSAKIIKPILRGRDIKRYGYEWAGLWLIFIPWHFPLHKDISITGSSQKAEVAFQKQYPAIFNHLLQFKEQLSQRNKAETGIRYEWYALQRCAATYYEEFEKEKVVWTPVDSEYKFCIIPSGYFFNNSIFMITSKIPKVICSIFNSNILRKYLTFNLSSENEYTYASKDVMEKIAIPPITKENKPIITKIELLVEEILTLKKENKNTTKLESEIDNLVYQLYNLTKEEIAIVEGSINGK
ncbi:MAG: DUF4391 domain-containing protein [Candidatus Atribacteria bacterium]|nr:DUF4391 domain-containing protein [Candidatus Atribacteria bacterium]